MDGTASLYDQDFYAWALEQAEKLRSWPADLRPNGIDVQNLAEEVEGLARSEARALDSLFRQLFARLLKIEWHPHQDSRRHWGVEVRGFRRALLRYGDPKSRHREPTLWSIRGDVALEAWERELIEFGERLAVDGHREAAAALAAATDPTRLPADLDGVLLDLDWLPEYRGPLVASPTPKRRRR